MPNSPLRRIIKHYNSAVNSARQAKIIIIYYRKCKSDNFVVTNQNSDITSKQAITNLVYQFNYPEQYHVSGHNSISYIYMPYIS